MLAKNVSDWLKAVEARDKSTDVYVRLCRGDTYHSRTDCDALRGTEPSQVRRFALKLAKAVGYTACEMCKSDG